MDRCPRLFALAAMLIGVAAMLMVPTVAGAQSDTVTIELNFETEAGEPPADSLSVVDLGSGREYRNAGVLTGEPIEITGTPGVNSVLQIRRTELQPGDVSCTAADDAKTVATSRDVNVVITPGSDPVVCTITLTDELPPPEDLAVTGPTSTPFASVGAMWLGGGAVLVAVARFAQQAQRSR